MAIENRSSTDLAMIAKSGGGLEVDGAHYSSSDLVMIARNLANGAKMKVVNSARFSTSDLAMIARSAEGKVTFA
jgi:hypothetical protein